VSEQSVAPRPPLLPTVVGLSMALVLPFTLRFLQPSAVAEPGRTSLNELAMWSITGLLLLLVVRWEGRRLSSIGLMRPRVKSVLLGLGATVLLLAVLGLYHRCQAMVHMPDETTAGLGRIRDYPVWLRLMLVVRAGFAEEILYRGYAIERMTSLTRSRLAGALLPLIIFTVAHAFFWGVAHLPLVFLMGGILTVFYVRKRDLTVNITAHFVIDFLGVFLAPFAPR
jgi:membrane protease YdiL (CAAX protease family)